MREHLIRVGSEHLALNAMSLCIVPLFLHLSNHSLWSTHHHREQQLPLFSCDSEIGFTIIHLETRARSCRIQDPNLSRRFGEIYQWRKVHRGLHRDALHRESRFPGVLCLNDVPYTVGKLRSCPTTSRNINWPLSYFFEAIRHQVKFRQCNLATIYRRQGLYRSWYDGDLPYSSM